MQIFSTIHVTFATLIVGMFFALVIGYAIGYFLRKMFTEYQIKEAEERKKKIIHEAKQEVASKLKTGEIEAREKSLVLKAELEKEVKGEWDRLRNLSCSPFISFSSSTFTTKDFSRASISPVFSLLATSCSAS